MVCSMATKNKLSVLLRWQSLVVVSVLVLAVPLLRYSYYNIFVPDHYPEVPTPTPNISEGENQVCGVVLHHTASFDLKGAIYTLTSAQKEVSCHVLIDRDGTRYLLASPEQITWHAGKSSLHGMTGVNRFTVGIEFLGNTEEKPLTRRQIVSAIEYLQPIVLHYHIPDSNIVTHAMVRNEWIISQNDTLCPTKSDIVETEYLRFLEEYHTRIDN